MDVWHLPEKDIERLKESRVILSMSGGKDSTACALLLERHGIKFDRIFLDTGWDHPAVFDYLNDVLEPRFGKIEKLKSEKFPGGLVDSINYHGYFPSRLSRYCTREFKTDLVKYHFRKLDDDIINVVGIRRRESKSRSLSERWQYDEVLKADVFRPLVDHSFDDVIQMHHEGQIEPNPLYVQGFNRVGCFPCIFAKKDEVAKVANLWPKRIDQIEELENKLTREAHEKYENDESFREKTFKKIVENVACENVLKPRGISRGDMYRHIKGKKELEENDLEIFLSECERLRSLGDGFKGFQDEKEKLLRHSFFEHRTTDKQTIRDVVEWSKTIRGGRQMQMFDLTAQDGCMRWGMCESPLANDELLKIQEPNK